MRLLALAVMMMACIDATAETYTVHTGRVPTGEPGGNVLVVGNCYALSLNTATKVADWCGFRVTAASQYGSNSLNRNWQNRFEAGTLEHQDYTHSDYSRGHLCPLASFRADPDASELNWMGNIAPQTQDLNAGPWLKFENFSRDLARMHDRVFVLVGPLYESPMDSLPGAEEVHVVPSHYWARIWIPDTEELYAWIIPQDCDRSDELDEYSVVADEVCRRSGLRICYSNACEACDERTGWQTRPTSGDRESYANAAGLGSSRAEQLVSDPHRQAACKLRACLRRGDDPRTAGGQHGNDVIPGALDRRCHVQGSPPLVDGCPGRDGSACGADRPCLRSGRHSIDSPGRSQGGRLMSNKIDAEIDGGEDMLNLLDQLPHQLRFEILPKALRAGGRVVQKSAKAKLPDPGYPGDKDPNVSLKKTIIVKVKRYDRAVTCVVGPTYLGVNHAHLVEFGHRLVRKVKSLAGVEMVEIGFVPAHPFLRTAADETQAQQQQAIVSVIQAEIDKYQQQMLKAA